MIDAVAKQTREKMQKALESLEQEMSALRTGRASVSLLDGVEVSAYETAMPLKQVATIAAPDAKTILIQPWDKNVIGAIEKAILAANLGVTPINDGKVIRISIPPLTEERRKELVKVAHKYAEAAKVAVRHVRRDGLDTVKKLEKNHEISEDDQERFANDVQKATDGMIAEIDQLLAAKEKEILTV